MIKVSHKLKIPKIKFAYYSKDKIEQLVPATNSILISITGTMSDFAKINDNLYKDILRLKFSDVQKDFGKFKAFTVYQAESVLDFVSKNMPINYVYINCEMGVSRSAGLLEGLVKIFNNEDISISTSNGHVRNKLIEANKAIKKLAEIKYKSNSCHKCPKEICSLQNVTIDTVYRNDLSNVLYLGANFNIFPPCNNIISKNDKFNVSIKANNFFQSYETIEETINELLNYKDLQFEDAIRLSKIKLSKEQLCQK